MHCLTRSLCLAVVKSVITHAVAIDNKLTALNRDWHAVVAAFVRQTLAQMDEPEDFIRRSLEENA